MKLLEPRTNKYIPWTPYAKQKAFLILDCKEAFYGGAAGGGKSCCLLFAAAQYVDVPGYNALLLRDSFANLSKPEGLIDLSFDWFIKSDAKWSENKKRWTFPSGATINFGHMDGPKAHFQYQSSSYHFIGIDEVVQIPRNQALYLFSRLRKTKNIEVPNRFRCASNPPTAEQMSTGAWVKERYVDPDTREEDVVFIPALMEDNPFLDTEDYDESLEKLDPVTRMQLRFGDWNVSVKGRMFERDWITGNVVNEPFGEIKDRIRYWDLASTEPSKRNRDPDFTAGVLMSINKNKDIFIEHIEHFREMPGTTERRVRRMAIRDGIGTDQVIERDPGGAGKALFAHYKRDVLFGYNTREGGISGSKAERAKPFSSHCMDGKVFLVRGPWIKNYLNELELFPDGPHDDMCFVAGTKISTLFGKIPIEKIKVGNYVITPFGLRKVLWAGKTGEKRTIKRFGLEGTENHLIFSQTQNNFIKFSDIKEEEIVKLSVKTLPYIVRFTYTLSNILRKFFNRFLTVKNDLDSEIKKRVYNLKVDRDPVYYANNILVHNCDGSSGAFFELAGALHVEFRCRWI